MIQLVNQPACHAEGRGFEPRRSRHDFASEFSFSPRSHDTLLLPFMTLLVGLRSLRLFMRMLFQLVKRGWRVVTEVHTTQWLIVSLVPSSALTAIVAFLGEHSVAVLATVFFLALVASALVVVAILGYRKEKEVPAARAPGRGRISLMEAATRAYEQTRNKPVARFAELQEVH